VTALALNRVCNLEDFEDPGLREVLREVFEHELGYRPDLPRGRELRKYWEVGMTVAAMRAGGALRPDAEVLGLGAGADPTQFFLTSHVRRVFATDLYLTPGIWAHQAPAEMLSRPFLFWRGEWEPRRLVVQHMDARELHYDDESFDAVFSSGSIEHFGDWADVEAAVAEAHRVLKPDGVLALSTEFRLEGPAGGMPGTLTFGPDELERHIAGHGRWSWIGEVDWSVSEETLATESALAEAGAYVTADSNRYGGYAPLSVSTLPAPHIVVRHGKHLFTSVHLALRKL